MVLGGESREGNARSRSQVIAAYNSSHIASGMALGVASATRCRRRARLNCRCVSIGLRCANASLRAREDGTGLTTDPRPKCSWKA